MAWGQKVLPLAVCVILGKLFSLLKPMKKGMRIANLTELLFRENNVCKALKHTIFPEMIEIAISTIGWQF